MSLVRHAKFSNFYEVAHPLIQHKLTCLRDRRTSKKEFSELVEEITMLMAYEATKDLPLTLQEIETPLERCKMPLLAGLDPVIMPILRAGLGMVNGMLRLIPTARVAHIGLSRNEKTLEPEFYYFKVPPRSAERQIFICDPMLATGGTAAYALTKLKELGIKKLTFVSIIASPVGVEHLFHEHPDVTVLSAKLDRELNQSGYILPGLGDAGDRLYGTCSTAA